MPGFLEKGMANQKIMAALRDCRSRTLCPRPGNQISCPYETSIRNRNRDRSAFFQDRIRQEHRHRVRSLFPRRNPITPGRIHPLHPFGHRRAPLLQPKKEGSGFFRILSAGPHPRRSDGKPCGQDSSWTCHRLSRLLYPGPSLARFQHCRLRDRSGGRPSASSPVGGGAKAEKSIIWTLISPIHP